jgi:chaperonin GroES
MKNFITPLSNRVVIHQHEAQEVTAGGILIPATSQDKPMRGVVVSIGAGTKEFPMTVKEGDEILYGKYNGIEGAPFIIMRESDILAILS